jgi:alpha-D-ribose 1-methylphosphonate 5-triphosphate synthase subunit PhnG
MQSRFSDELLLKEARRNWLQTLVRVPATELIKASDMFSFEVSTLKAPEVGLMMTNGRIHSTGQPFHLGEVSLTRCVLKDELGHLGYGHILGRNKAQSRAIALFDLALQRTDYADQANQMLDVWCAEIEEIHAAEAERIEQTRVDFFTMVRGEA